LLGFPSSLFLVHKFFLSVFFPVLSIPFWSNATFLLLGASPSVVVRRSQPYTHVLCPVLPPLIRSLRDLGFGPRAPPPAARVLLFSSPGHRAMPSDFHVLFCLPRLDPQQCAASLRCHSFVPAACPLGSFVHSRLPTSFSERWNPFLFDRVEAVVVFHSPHRGRCRASECVDFMLAFPLARFRCFVFDATFLG